MSDGRLRVLTVNLLNGRGDADALVRHIDELEVDVVACQELAPEQAAAVATRLPHGKLEPTRDFQGMGIALRRPGETRRLPLRHRDARVVTLDPEHWPGLPARIEVVNAHLNAPHAGWPWKTVRRRIEQVSGLRHHLAGPAPAHRVLLGDLNATPAWPAYRRLTEVLPDVVVEHARGRGSSPAATWSLTKRRPNWLRLDHVLARGFVAGDVRVLPVPGTDHDALFVELEPA